jgi:hypothetical protein
MIKPNELRVGNWVNWLKPEMKPTYEQVYELSEDIINEDKPEHYDPSPINKEIITKAGFIKSKSVFGYYHKSGLKITLNDERCIYQGRLIRNIHDLQNLFFSITSEELEIKL